MSEIFGFLTVIGDSGTKYQRCRLYDCECICGNRVLRRMADLKSGRKKSCGCMQRVGTHRAIETREYRQWASMLQRCTNKKFKQYSDYGGRGISVCEEWKSFENFIKDMGKCPDGKTLGRINNDLGYFLGNVRWESWEEQAKNKRNSVYVNICGVEFNLADAARHFGISYNAMYGRVAKGYHDLDLTCRNLLKGKSMGSVFQQLNEIHNKVQSGEITGYVSWPVEGHAEVIEVGTEYKSGKAYLSVTMKHEEKGAQIFLVKIPDSADKDNAKFMNLQRLYGILYPIANASPGKHSPEQAYNMAVAELKEGSLLCRYVMREYDQLDQKTGKTYTNQSLESIKIIEDDGGEFA